MNNKIAFPELVDTIAELTNTSKRVSELFLKELFGVIKERLEQGETVKIKNLGTFKVVDIASRKSVNVNTGEDMEIPAHRRVSFTPDKSLAEAINMPFEGFETVMLDDDISEAELNELASADLPELEEKKAEPVAGVEDIAEEQEVEKTEITHPEQVAEPQPPVFMHEEDTAEPEHTDEAEQPSQVEEVLIEAAPSEEVEAQNEEPAEKVVPEETISHLPVLVEESTFDEYEYYEEVKREKRKSFVWGLVAALVAVLLIGYFAINRGYVTLNIDSKSVPAVAVNDTVSVANDVIAEPVADTIAQAEPAKPEPVVVTDTVRANYYLTKMSRKHYGRYEFWVYIYEENKDKIANPNSVSPGLVVVIPPAEKYGIDKNDEESVRKAKEIAERF